MQKRIGSLLSILFVLCLLLGGCGLEAQPAATSSAPGLVSLQNLPEFAGTPYVELNQNQPEFAEEEKNAQSFENYSELDALGRCGVAYACIGQDLMPTEDRESISQVKPSGWQTAEYDFVDGKYLYNRCHLIGFQLTAENANEKNLITGTRYLNVEGMLAFENMTADYIKETGNHVLYRVTPVFESSNLVASGVQMEAWSVEDNGAGICFNVFVYNNQPGVTIDYQTGNSWASGSEPASSASSKEVSAGEEYVLNTNSHKFHRPDCSSVETMNEKNKEIFHGDRTDLIAQGYEPCQSCKP